MVKIVMRDDDRVDVFRVEADPPKDDLRRRPVLHTPTLGRFLCECIVFVSGVDQHKMVLALERKERERKHTSAGVVYSVDHRSRRILTDPCVFQKPYRIVRHLSLPSSLSQRSTLSAAAARASATRRRWPPDMGSRRSCGEVLTESNLPKQLQHSVPTSRWLPRTVKALNFLET